MQHVGLAAPGLTTNLAGAAFFSVSSAGNHTAIRLPIESPIRLAAARSLTPIRGLRQITSGLGRQQQGKEKAHEYIDGLEKLAMQ